MAVACGSPTGDDDETASSESSLETASDGAEDGDGGPGPASSDPTGSGDEGEGGDDGPPPSTTGDAGYDPPPNLVVDHTWVDRFDEIPAEYLSAAADMRMFFMDRSVGANIDEGLHCLASAFADAPSHCRRADHVDPAFSVEQSAIEWSGSYDRSNWAFDFWPDGCDGWSDKVDCFFGYVEPGIADWDVVSFQFSYLMVGEGSDIADPATGFFVDRPDATDIHDYRAFGDSHGKVLIYWTTSLARGIGTPEATAFNAQMREWTAAADVPLFDVADILAHDPSGAPCWDNRDAIPFTNGNNSEDWPDDGEAFPAICQHYTTETDGGHLGAVSVGKIRVAKGFWVLMARIAGWEPD